MSGSVDVVRRIYEAVARRDPQTVRSLYDPAVELRFAPGTLGDQLGARSLSGLDGIRAFDRDLRASFDDFETPYDELIDAGDRVVSVSRYRGRGQRSGVEIAGPLQFLVWTVDAGRVTRVEWYATRGEALRAAGLET